MEIGESVVFVNNVEGVQAGRHGRCDGYARCSRDGLWKGRAKERGGELMINARKKRHGAIEIADPNLDCAGVEVEGPFFVDLSLGVRSGKDLYANRRGSGKRGRWISDQPTFLSDGEQDDIGDSDLAVASKDSLLDCGEFASIQLVEEIGNSASSLAMIKARRWRHDELAGSVDLEAFGAICEGGIAADLEPPFGSGFVERDRHTGKIRQKWKKA